MTDAAAVMASLVDVRNIAAHKCVRLEIHVPAEQAGIVLAAFGWPTAVDPVPVVIARIDPAKAVSEAPKVAQVTDKTESWEFMPRRKFAEMPLAAQAGMRCAEPAFNRFIEQQFFPASGALDVAQAVRDHCGVKSRSEIVVGSDAASKWHNLMRRYELWLLAAEPT